MFNNDGVFYLRTFGKESRDEADIEADELNINKLIGLDNHTMCIFTFPDPYITCCFVTDNIVYINLFHNATLTHYHLIYDVDAKRMVG